MENNRRRKWITPFMRQVFVVLGASLNMGQLSLVVGFTARLLPQLRRTDSTIPLDDSSASWIASSVGVTLIAGNVLVGFIMGKYGRRPAGIVSNFLLLIGWIWVSLATSITSLIMARLLQGLALGMVSINGSTVIGECSSPKKRAMFTSLSVFIFCFVLIVIHTMGSYLSWRLTSFLTAGITFVNFVMILLSPETPSWLADQGRYEDCRKIFHFLRGTDEDDELDKLIEASKSRRNAKLIKSWQADVTNISSKLASYIGNIKLRRFYIPMIVGINISVLQQWCGLNIIIGFIEDEFYWIVGPNEDFGFQILLVDFTRLLTAIVGIYIVKKFRRRDFLLTTVGANIAILLLIAAYTYAKLNQLLLFDNRLIGIMLAHLLIISLSIGASPLVLTITSEIFPLEFRSFMSSFSKVIASINFFIVTKTFGFCVKSLGFHGTFCLYAMVTGVNLAILMIFLPETKDKTLQEIENELKGKDKVLEENQENYPMNASTVAE